MKKFSTPYSAVPLTAINKKHSMSTAENAQRKSPELFPFSKGFTQTLPDSQDPAPADDVVPLLNVAYPSEAVEETMGEIRGIQVFATPRRSGCVISAPT